MRTRLPHASTSSSPRGRPTLALLCLDERSCGRGRLSLGWASADDRLARNRKAQW